MIFRQGRKISFISPFRRIIIRLCRSSFGEANNHSGEARLGNLRIKAAAICGGFYQLLALLFASLVSNTARGLASRLAGGLALAASAVLNGSAEVTGIDSTNSLHCKFHLSEFFITI